MDGAFLTGFVLFAALFFVGLNGVFVLTEFAFATIRGAQVERLVNEGRVQIREVNEAIGSGFEAESFDIMGGLVLDLLGRPPKTGDEVWVDGEYGPEVNLQVSGVPGQKNRAF